MRYVVKFVSPPPDRSGLSVFPRDPIGIEPSSINVKEFVEGLLRKPRNNLRYVVIKKRRGRILRVLIPQMILSTTGWNANC